MMGYRIETTPDDNDTVLVTVPSLPEVTTFASAELDEHLAARAAIGEALAGRIASGQDLPDHDPDPEAGARYRVVYLDPLVEAKVELYRALRRAGLTRAELQRRMNVAHREQIDRLFRLDHASRMDQLEDAFKALGLRLSVQITEAA